MSQSERYLAWLHRGNLHGVWGGSLAAGFFLLGKALGLPAIPANPWWIPVAGVAGFAIGKLLGLALLGAAGGTAQRIYMPAAAGTYAQSHSRIDTLEARGDNAGAVAAWEAVAVAQPRNPWPLLRAGELYARRLGEPGMALDRFRLARDVPGIAPELHRYATQKIIDLYLGPLEDEGRALVELRRLADGHPGTPEARGAVAAIERLKRDRRPPAPG